MDAVDTRRPPSEQLKQFLATRRGAYTAALAAALLAGLVLVVFITQYRSSVTEGLEPTPVLTADRLIPVGTAGGTVIAEKLFEPTAVPEEDITPGAITDAAAIKGKVAVQEVLPGQQITAAHFAAEGDPIRSRLQKNERAIQVPIDDINGLIGTVRPGDRIDILAAFNAQNAGNGAATPSITTLMRDVRVMAAPGYSSAVQGSVILQLTDREAAKLAYASDNAKLWFLLRPTVGATESSSVSAGASSFSGAGS